MMFVQPLGSCLTHQLCTACDLLQVAELGMVLPVLCCCNMTSHFDPAYVYKCTRNCALYHRPDLYEHLMTNMLRGFDVI